MKRNLLTDFDAECGLWRHRYGNGEARVTVAKRSRGLTAAQLEECDAMLDLALEQPGPKEVARIVLSPLFDGVFPPEEKAQILLDTRGDRLH